MLQSPHLRLPHHRRPLSTALLAPDHPDTTTLHRSQAVRWQKEKSHLTAKAHFPLARRPRRQAMTPATMATPRLRHLESKAQTDPHIPDPSLQPEKRTIHTHPADVRHNRETSSTLNHASFSAESVTVLRHPHRAPALYYHALYAVLPTYAAKRNLGIERTRTQAILI